MLSGKYCEESKINKGNYIKKEKVKNVLVGKKKEKKINIQIK